MQPVFFIEDRPQAEVLVALRDLYFADAATFLDATYGTGRFYSSTAAWPYLIRADLHPARAVHCQLDFRCLPFGDASLDCGIFDPPFQPRTTRQQAGEMERRFTHIGTCNRIGELTAAVQQGCVELRRVCRVGALIKVQDYVHNHRRVLMTEWVREVLGRPADVVHVRRPTPKLRASNWSRQLSVWSNGATFLVYRWN